MGHSIKAMQAAVDDGDFDALRTAAHKLKGCGGGYGYPVLTERAGELEQHAKAEALDECVKGVDGLSKLCNRVVVEEG